MGKKKGLSAEEKALKIKEIYHTTLDVFNLKEIEKLASAKGVVEKTVKDVNKGLVDDNEVDAEKIGSGMFFWSFPSKKFQQLQTQIQNHQDEIDNCESQIASIEKQLEIERRTRPPSESRKRKLAELGELQELDKKQRVQEEALAENDPEELARLEQATKLCKDRANQWTENIWEIKSWLVKKRNMDPKRVDAMIGITADFDYVD
uniref:Meiotic nuclear division protein 1 homolog n=1 Tax=Phaeomonas parva TaxID=124430 RepID=A0A6U4KZ14_9STRA